MTFEELLLALALVLGGAGIFQLLRRPSPNPAPPAPPGPTPEQIHQIEQVKVVQVEQAQEDRDKKVDQLIEQQKELTDRPSMGDIKAVVDYLQKVGIEVRNEQAPDDVEARKAPREEGGGG